MDDSELFELIRRHTIEVVPEIEPAEVRPDRTLADLGCNSIDRADILTMTMEDLGIVVAVPEFQSAHSIETLISLLRKHL